ncbi:MAG: hypothetical protein COB24_12870 [Hyphomicrobiales bacterium]|nr:MAG: hypothetical protein COB24_12870 [Hyphomicrobiales bacterium]
MQLNSDKDRQLAVTIVGSLQAERVNRYKAAADANGVMPIDLYLWNCNISCAFYDSIHFAEICCRNTIHSALVFRNKDNNWYEDETFRKLLDLRFLRELETAIDNEKNQHGQNITCHHVVSALTFGFWEHLTTRRFKRYLWPRGFQRNFKNAPFDATLHDLNKLIQSVRRWRNRIAHHRAIFDKNPNRKHSDSIMLISWSSSDVSEWVAKQSNVSKTINQRPRP